MSNSGRSNIAIISAAAFLYISKLLGSYNFKLCICSSDIQANSTKLAEAPDLSNIFSEYHKFANVFSRTKAEVLVSHHSYDFKINLKEGAQPPVGLIYSLLASEQEALKEFIEENLNQYGFHLTNLISSVDFHSLNCISKKDCYLLLLISNLLDSPYKA